MPELLLELFSEEIPARLQARGADELSRLVQESLAAIAPANLRLFYGPRRLALAAEVTTGVAATASIERGPRVNAPEQALAGFLRKHAAAREALRQDGDVWVLDKAAPAVSAASLVASAMPGLLRRFAWPKSMRWGGTSSFTWIRPLRRILCLLDGAVVPFSLAQGEDDGHGLVSGDLTEGHRTHAPGPVSVRGVQDWVETLRLRQVVAGAADRARLVRDGLTSLAAAHGLTLLDDPALLDEVAGLVEWPVPLLGRIDEPFMDLPPEVMQVSLRVNQRYFVMRDAAGAAAPWFGFAANIEALDEGAAIIAGNERVLRARLSDARHFWDLDRRVRLESRVPSLANVMFHAKLGSQLARTERVANLAEVIARGIGASVIQAVKAAHLAKADLTCGMVGEFPELQGVMGGYYARHDGEDEAVCDAIRDHYLPRGFNDSTPIASVSIALALADKIDQITTFFAVGERPTGSGDPFALRRAALGLIRILRSSGLEIRINEVTKGHVKYLEEQGLTVLEDTSFAVLEFLEERLRHQLRSQGFRHDIVSAVLPTGLHLFGDFDIGLTARRAEAVASFLLTHDGENLRIAYKRTTSILVAEEKRDAQTIDKGADLALLQTSEERELWEVLSRLESRVQRNLDATRFEAAMSSLAKLREPLDAFFEAVTVNDKRPEQRQNRLRLLASVRAIMERIADFSEIEG